MESQNQQRLQFCEICDRLKIYGTHHCKECNICTTMLCHHSYFVNNCIGLNNFVYYFSFLVYSWFGLMYTAFLFYGPFYACFIRNDRHPVDKHKFSFIDYYTCQEAGELPLVFIAACCIHFSNMPCFLPWYFVSSRHVKGIIQSEAKKCKNLYLFAKTVLRKSLMRHRRVKFNVLIYQRKKTWKHFLFPTFNETVQKYEGDYDGYCSDFNIHII